VECASRDKPSPLFSYSPGLQQLVIGWGSNTRALRLCLFASQRQRSARQCICLDDRALAFGAGLASHGGGRGVRIGEWYDGIVGALDQPLLIRHPYRHRQQCHRLYLELQRLERRHQRELFCFGVFCSVAVDIRRISKL
jgi:hypothetical protein